LAYCIQAVFETYKKLAHEQGWDFRWSFLDVQGRSALVCLP
jgi:hypothetical protein